MTAQPEQSLEKSLARELAQRELIERLETDLQACAAQITEDFEELSLLRTFAMNLELSDDSTDLSSLARSLLPGLCHSVKAEGLALLLKADASDENVVWMSDQSGSILWAGNRVTDEVTCRRMVHEYGDAAAEQPLVCNDSKQFPCWMLSRGIRAFVLVPIVKAHRRYGWFVVLNHVLHHGMESARNADSRCDACFGTSEAGLLVSAASILATQARNVEQFCEREQLLVSVVRALVSAVEAKDEYTRGHSERVALYAARLGRELGLNSQKCDRLYLTGLIHDVGKIGVQDDTLGKSGQLTDEEAAEIRKHPDLGWGILQQLKQLNYVLPGVVHHHERFDGNGYPDGLAGTNIPLDGRIIAVADAYDAMTSDRPYRKGMPQEEATDILREGAGMQWEPKIIGCFLKIIPEIAEINRLYQRAQHTAQSSRRDKPRENNSAIKAECEIETVELPVVE